MKNIVIIARPAKLRLEQYLEENKIEYKFKSLEEIPDGNPGGCKFRGQTFVGPDKAVAVESELNKEEIYNILYKIIPGTEKYRESDK